ncbi:hypothetical protein Lalb_Chr03g0025631 [Lupinus albus]|uniref:Uncharacterized protein n=1 Tax=Lupinus albus TaxID=3870 RepID=A0A6A4QR48_LUPAL|nr:hypothetical protein Lalb_Chr03g0025631 [Lupinus albus]
MDPLSLSYFISCSSLYLNPISLSLCTSFKLTLHHSKRQMGPALSITLSPSLSLWNTST